MEKNRTSSTTMVSPILCYPNMINSRGILNGDSPLDFSVPLLLLQITLVNVVSSLVLIIFKPLNLPSIMSKIIGGILVGPSGLGRNKVFLETLFPRRSFNVMSNAAILGIIYHNFLIGARQDPKVVIHAGSRAWKISSVGLLVPLMMFFSMFVTAKSMVDSVGSNFFFILLALLIAVTSFPTIHRLLADLNLLNTKLGRLAISTATTNNVIEAVFIIIFKIIRQGPQIEKGLYYLVSLTAFILICFLIVRPAMFRVIHKTPIGRPVDRKYVTIILLVVLVFAFVSDTIGVTMTNGALIIGFAMPDGDPLGSTLVDKTEFIVESFLMPLVYASIGLKTDIFGIKDSTAFFNLVYILILGHAAKFMGTLLLSRHLSIPFYDSISLSLIMNFKGVVELISLARLTDSKIIEEQAYTTVVLDTVVITGFAASLVKWLSRDSMLYRPYNRRTIEHSKPNMELRILTCIHTQENVPAIINLLESSHATEESPIRVCSLNLVKLEGRAAPMLISHSLHSKSSSSTISHIDHINKALQNYEEKHEGCLSIHYYTSVSPYITMYQDVCMLALDKKVSLLVLPFHKQHQICSEMDAATQRNIQNLNSKILVEAPCSVGILVDGGCGHHSFMQDSWYHICVIFLGGADDREALSYGIRMASHPHTMLDVVRISAFDDDWDDDEEAQLDDKLVTFFQHKYVDNENVVYRGEKVDSGADTLRIIETITNQYNLVIVGRRHESSSRTIQGLSEWCEDQELGVIGDLLLSSDFSTQSVSVLVLQQQINTGIKTFNIRNLRFSRAFQSRFHNSIRN